jgi:hypothetical protein
VARKPKSKNDNNCFSHADVRLTRLLRHGNLRDARPPPGCHPKPAKPAPLRNTAAALPRDPRTVTEQSLRDGTRPPTRFRNRCQVLDVSFC